MKRTFGDIPNADQLRPYQRSAVEVVSAKMDELADATQFIRVRMACGTGKSRVAAHLLRKLRADGVGRVVVLVPSTHLMEQLVGGFASVAPEIPVGRVGDTHGEFDRWCTVCVYASLHRLAEHGVRPHTVLVDEAHHIEGAFCPDPQKGVWRGRARELGARRYVMMSATLRVNEELLGPLDYEYPLRQAIEEGYLAKFGLAVPVVRDCATMREPTTRALRDHLVRLIREHTEWRHPLAYCNTCAEAEQFAGELRAAGVSAQFFDGRTPVGLRNEHIANFRGGEPRVLCTVQVLGEGVDIPCADTCIFVQPRGSSIDVVQCVGRVLRLHPGKTRAWVVSPSLHERAELKRVVELLTDEFPELYDSITGGGADAAIDTAFVSAGASGGTGAGGYTAYFRELAGMLKSPWDSNYERLVAYVALRGKIPSLMGGSFNRWLGTQRAFYAQKRLPRTRIEMLEGVPGWVWETNEPRWVENYEKMIKNYVDYREDDKYISGWKQRQRSLYRKKKLSDERINLLERLEWWEWNPDSGLEKRDTMYRALAEYMRANNSMPPHGHRLYKWVNKIQSNYKRNLVSAHYIAMLESLPLWKWGSERSLTTWDDSYRELKRCTADGGELSVPLVKWVRNQKLRHKSLSKAHIEKLEEIPGWTW